MTEQCPEGSVGDLCCYSCMKDHRGIGMIHGECVIRGETVIWALSETCMSFELVGWCLGGIGVGILIFWSGIRRRKMKGIEREQERRQLDGMIVAVYFVC